MMHGAFLQAWMRADSLATVLSGRVGEVVASVGVRASAGHRHGVTGE